MSEIWDLKRSLAPIKCKRSNLTRPEKYFKVALLFSPIEGAYIKAIFIRARAGGFCLSPRWEARLIAYHYKGKSQTFGFLRKLFATLYWSKFNHSAPARIDQPAFFSSLFIPDNPMQRTRSYGWAKKTSLHNIQKDVSPQYPKRCLSTNFYNGILAINIERTDATVCIIRESWMIWLKLMVCLVQMLRYTHEGYTLLGALLRFRDSSQRTLPCPFLHDKDLRIVGLTGT